MTLTGASMFVGLMVGGVLADRYERKRLILLARGTCGVGFVGLCLNALLPEPSLAGDLPAGDLGWVLRLAGGDRAAGGDPGAGGAGNLMQAGAITMLTCALAR